MPDPVGPYAPGDVLAGTYRIEGLIGEGGFGQVYHATHLALRAPVAIKVLHERAVQNPENHARFLREARILARLQHPALVTVHDFGADGAGRPYMVMELLRGQPLSERLLVGDQLLPPRLTCRILAQVLGALQVAHEAGIVHRDLKPDNIMLLGEEDPARGQVKVLDFGLALIRPEAEAEAGPLGGRITAGNEVHGTPLYMAPEQCRNRRIGPPADIYAVGVILYEMLCGEPPFAGRSNADLMVQHNYLEPPPLSTRGVRRPAPPALEALCLRALRKRPEDRPTAPEMRAALLAVPNDADADADAAAQSGPTRVDGPASAAPASPPAVLLWGFPAARAEALRTALSVNGLKAEGLAEISAPPLQRARALLLRGGPEARASTAALRAEAPGLPILVLDLDRQAHAEDIAALIRAGASDTALATLTEDQICRKVWRLVRRGR
jgi:serine/threonine-protein kinase